MSDTDSRRLRVFVRVQSTPVKIDIEFPDENLAKYYCQSIKGSKKSVLKRPSTVRMSLPPSAIDLEMSRSLGAIVLHFRDGDSAMSWIDDICRPVQGQTQQVYFKKYWNDTDFAHLQEKLEQNGRHKEHKDWFNDACGQVARIARRCRGGRLPGAADPSSKRKSRPSVMHTTSTVLE